MTNAALDFVDPELRAKAASVPPVVMTNELLAPLRAMGAQMWSAELRTAATDHVIVTQHIVSGPANAPDVRILVFAPHGAARPMPAYLFLHGGGFVMGAAEMKAPVLMAVAQQIQCLVVSVDYRLSPDTIFPGALEDCYAALTWLHESAEALGVDRKRIAVGGESAGGGLAASLALLTRDRGAISICQQILLQPMLDDRTAHASGSTPHHFIWSAQNNRFGWTAYLGQEPGGSGISPYAAVARAQHLEGLPPTFIGVGALDIFAEESVEYARRMTRAGVPTELHVYPGAYHAFDMVHGAAVTQAFLQDWRRALRRGFQGEASGASP